MTTQYNAALAYARQRGAADGENAAGWYVQDTIRRPCVDSMGVAGLSGCLPIHPIGPRTETHPLQPSLHPQCHAGCSARPCEDHPCEKHPREME